MIRHQERAAGAGLVTHVTTRGLLLGAALVASLAATHPAAAGSLLLTASRPGNYTNTSTSPVAVPLDGGGHTAISFTTSTPNEKVRIVYNAECGALGPPEAWLAIEIMVDGNPTNPNSGTSFAMCTSTSTSAYSWTGAVRQSIDVVATPGVHTLQVLGAGQAGTTTWWLGDTSVVVDH